MTTRLMFRCAVLAQILVAAGVAVAATTVTYTGGSAADPYDISLADNWGGTLPSGAGYNASFTKANDAAHPFTFASQASGYTLSCDIIYLKNDLCFDLGAGRSLLSTANNGFQFSMNCPYSVTVKSGTVGSGWDSGSRATMLGPNQAIIADGADAVISGYKANSFRVGANDGGCRVEIRNGATLKAHPQLGYVAAADGNQVVITGIGSRHLISSDASSSVPHSALGIGAASSGNVYMVTNQATLKIEKTGYPVYVGFVDGNYALAGSGTFLVCDHATVDSAGPLNIGLYSGGNSAEISGGSSAAFTALTMGDCPNDVHSTAAIGTATADNALTVEGAGTRLGFSSDVLVGSKNTTNNVLMVSNGAVLSVTDGKVSVGDQASGGNRLVVDGATVAITNADARAVQVGYTASCGNALEVGNGARFDVANGTLRVGYGVGSESNVVKVTGGSVLNMASGDGATIGSSGPRNGFLADASTVAFGGGQNCFVGLNTGTDGCWAKVLNGSTFAVGGQLRVGVNGNDCTMEVDGSTVTASAAVDLGKNNTSTGNWMRIHSDAHVVCGTTFRPGADCGVEFVIDEDAVANGADGTPLLDVASTLSTFSTDADHPSVVRITVADKYVNGGTFCLVKSAAKAINWTNMRIDCDAAKVTVVQQDAEKLVVKAKSKRGLMLIFR